MNTISIRLQQQHTGKPEELIRARYTLMAEDAFAFYRGTCRIFYEDLNSALAGSLPDSPPAWISGDLHIANFGTYRGSTGLVYFDINDFDEAVLAPALWEISLLAASILVSCKCRKMSDTEASFAARHCLNIYAGTLVAGKALYVEMQIAEKEGRAVSLLLKKASEEKMKDLLQKETKKLAGQRVFDTGGKNNSELEDKFLQQALLHHLANWVKNRDELNLKQYTVEDVVFRLAGTGGIGLSRYMFLLHRNTDSVDSSDYLILEMKEAGPSSLLPFPDGIVAQPSWASQAQRIVAVQERMQAVSPPILGTTFFQNKHYVLQQRQPEKRKIDFEKSGLNDTLEVTGCMARLTAYAQLRSAGRQGSDNADTLIAFGENRSAWFDGTLNYARHYANQVINDYQQFKADLDAGFFR